MHPSSDRTSIRDTRRSTNSCRVTDVAQVLIVFFFFYKRDPIPRPSVRDDGPSPRRVFPRPSDRLFHRRYETNPLILRGLFRWNPFRQRPHQPLGLLRLPSTEHLHPVLATDRFSRRGDMFACGCSRKYGRRHGQHTRSMSGPSLLGVPRAAHPWGKPIYNYAQRFRSPSTGFLVYLRHASSFYHPNGNRGEEWVITQTKVHMLAIVVRYAPKQILRYRNSPSCRIVPRQ